jgi:hypothetical protein
MRCHGNSTITGIAMAEPFGKNLRGNGASLELAINVMRADGVPHLECMTRHNYVLTGLGSFLSDGVSKCDEAGGV